MALRECPPMAANSSQVQDPTESCADFRRWIRNINVPDWAFHVR